MVNVTNGKIIRLLVDDEPFDVRYGELRAARAGARLPRRGAATRASSGSPRRARRVRISSVRLVSFAHRAIAAILYEVEPLDGAARVVVQSELVANEPLPAAVDGDPRVATGWARALRSEYHADHGARVDTGRTRTTRAGC